MRAADQEERDHEQLLASADDFVLEPLAAHLFPSGVSAADKAVDLKLLALEQYELAQVILEDGEPEVDGVEGMKDVAAVYALFESSLAGRAVQMSEVEGCQVYEYQAGIDAALGIE